VQIKATPLDVPVTLDAAGIEKNTSLSVCLVEIRADDGMTGHGFTAITEEEVVAAAVNQVIAPALQDEDPLAHERIWERLYWLLIRIEVQPLLRPFNPARFASAPAVTGGLR